MSCYKKIIILFLFLFAINLQASKAYGNEDRDILFAIEFERLNDVSSAKFLYLKLFEKSNNYEYLLRYLSLSLNQRKFKEVKYYALNNLDKESLQYEQILRIYIISLINLQEFKEALHSSRTLLSQNKSALNYEIVANVYFAQRKYKEAIEYFESSYIVNNSPKVLFNLVNILYAYANEKNKAISYLETHIRLNGCDYLVCSKLLSIYQEQKNLDGIISVLKTSYFSKNSNSYYSKDKTLNLLISYMAQKDINLAISFLEKNKLSDDTLFALYKRANLLSKAYLLVKKIYIKNKEIDYLAQIAILEFELAKNKRKVLNSVIEKFEKVLRVLDNHVYQNYLGYILIEYDKDIKRGLMYVNKALLQAPKNVAYLDSLAWGEYKLGRCKKAKEHMQEVINEVGEDDLEIKHHWKKIKECLK